MSYVFIANDSTEDEHYEADEKWNWGYSDHTTATNGRRDKVAADLEDALGELDSEVDGDLIGILSQAEDMVESTTISKFECPHEDCGLGHNHPDWKHDITAHYDASNIRSSIPGFYIREDFVKQMEFVRNCHCGANEMAMLVKFFPAIGSPVFKDEWGMVKVKDFSIDEVNEAYRDWSSGNVNAGKAIEDVVSMKLPEETRDHFKKFFQRREQIETQANKAPIGQETRVKINDLREGIESAISNT